MLKNKINYLSIILLVIGLVFASSSAGAAIEVGEVPQDVEEEFIYEPEGIEVESWVQDLEIPWQLIFLPESDRALVTERPGRIRLIKNGELRSDLYADIDAAHYGEGGLMGIDYHPDFPEEPYLYIMYTYQNQAGDYYNRISRLTDNGDTAGDEEVILDEIPAGQNHNGGRIKFGPDKKLYATTGDTWQRQLAQDLDSLAGKILRLNPDGTIPEDNPFEDSYVYSLGHRNPQGLAWNQEGVLFISDHGPSGEDGLQNKDMVKVIEPGGNYGWPERIGYFGDGKYLDPLIMWPDSVPPSGAEFVGNDLFIATLRSRALIRVSLEEVAQDEYNVNGIERWFAEESSSGRFGRLRDVNRGPDGNLYILTSNRDGRGSPLEGDDQIYRIIID
ncbi:MAG: PQQ-dependent sugar dehydrogenase [Halanaerobiaceae bacterium]